MKTSSLARLGHSADRKYKALAVLKAYFDETGTHEKAPVTIVCGVVAPMDTWDAFDSDWKTQLDVPKVPYFHAVECEHGKGVFEPLSKGLRDSLNCGLADVVGKHPIKIVNAGIHASSWTPSQSPRLLKIFSSPYHVCFAHCLTQIAAWSEIHANGEPVALVFSEQLQYQAQAQIIYDAYAGSKESGMPIASLQFASMKDFPGLQAADLVCYEAYLHSVSGITNPEDVTRVGMKRLLTHNLDMMSSPFDVEAWKKAFRKKSTSPIGSKGAGNA